MTRQGRMSLLIVLTVTPAKVSKCRWHRHDVLIEIGHRTCITQCHLSLFVYPVVLVGPGRSAITAPCHVVTFSIESYNVVSCCWCSNQAITGAHVFRLITI